MSYPINYPTPQNCNTQIFYGANLGSSSNAPVVSRTWVKPKGASFVWFTLIGGGGGGGDNSAGGGGSGAVTNCLMPAFLVPDQLRVLTTFSSTITIVYQGPNGSAGYVLLTAEGGGIGSAGAGGTGAVASSRSAFAAAGLYQSIAGQAGSAAASLSASTTTFLSGGSGKNNQFITPNYGYPTSSGNHPAGFFQMSPIVVGRGGSVAINNSGTVGGIGCGAGGSDDGAAIGGLGGQSMAVIISW